MLFAAILVGVSSCAEKPRQAAVDVNGRFDRLVLAAMAAGLSEVRDEIHNRCTANIFVIIVPCQL